MIEFRFKAWNADGQPKEGILTAGSREEARSVLEQSGLTINYVKRATDEDLQKHQRLEASPRKPPRYLGTIIGLSLVLVLLLVYQFWSPAPTGTVAEGPIKVTQSRVQPKTSNLRVSGRVELGAAEGDPDLRVSETRIAVFFKSQSDEAVTLSGDIEWESDGSYEFTLPLEGPPPDMTVNLTYRHPKKRTLRHRAIPVKTTRRGYEVAAPPADLRPELNTKRGRRTRGRRDRRMRKRLERSAQPSQKLN